MNSDEYRPPGMPIKVCPYAHQRQAFTFACRLFGLWEKQNDDNDDDERTDMSKEKGGDAHDFHQ